jgi:DNA-binding MurR/RpiR family transcriptional regulator
VQLRHAIQAYGGQLSPSEQTVLREVLNNPTQAAFLSATQLADRSGVHAATVVRLAQKLGYAGYPELRAGLAADVLEAQPRNSGERVQRSLERSKRGDVLGGLIQAEVGSLSRLHRHVTQTQLEAASDLLHRARRTYLFAGGHATALAELLDRRLRRSGHDTVDLRVQGRELAERIVTLDAHDVVLAFALRKAPAGLRALLEHAHAKGVPTILIADTIGPLTRPQPTLLLSAPRGDDTEFQTLTVPMTIVNALVLTLAQRDEGRSIATLNQLEELIHRFEEET